MKNYILPLVLFLTVVSCNEENPQPLSGRYNFIEPPHPISRLNRLDYSQVAFDVIFTINGNEFTEVDLVIDAQQITPASGNIQDRTIVFEGGGGTITIHGVRKSGSTLQASGAEFMINGETKNYGPLQIDSY